MSNYSKAQRTAYYETVLNDVSEHQGTKMNSIATRVNLGDATVYNVVRTLIREKKIIKQGGGSKTRYYTADYDRTTHNEYDTIPIVNRVANKTKVEYKPHPDSLLAVPDMKGIPDNIFNVELTAETAGLEEEPVEEVIEEPVQEEEPVVNYDRIMEAVKVFSDWTDIAGVDAIIKGLEAKLSEAVKPCPFCGEKSRLVRSGTGEFRIECDCGFRFANVKYTRSAVDTIQAYNKRVTA